MEKRGVEEEKGLREARNRLSDVRKILGMLPSMFHDRVAAGREFSAVAMADDLRKCAVVLQGLQRLQVYVPEDFDVLLRNALSEKVFMSPSAVASLVELATAKLLSRASVFAVSGTEIEWEIVRKAMRRAAVVVVDLMAAAEARAIMNSNAQVGLLGVSRAAIPAVGASSEILVREAERADADDPAAALAAGLRDRNEARVRILRARRRIKAAKRAPQAKRLRKRKAALNVKQAGSNPAKPRKPENLFE